MTETPDINSPASSVEASSSVSPSLASSLTTDGERVGRPITGLYPEVSRHKLAAVTKLSVSTISGYLSGKKRCPAEVGAILAKGLGITMDQLYADLKAPQKEWLARRARERAAKKSVNGRAAAEASGRVKRVSVQVKNGKRTVKGRVKATRRR